MQYDYILTARKLSGGNFTAEPGNIQFVKVPRDAEEYDKSNIIPKTTWVNEVIGLADGDENPLSISPKGDILVYVHGFSNTIANVLARQRSLTANLKAESWRGVVVSFDWPSDNQILGYYEDRHDGAQVARLLVETCLAIVVAEQAHGCVTNIHLLGHSAGAYVICKALEFSPNNGAYFKSDWRLGQVAFVAADVSRTSFFDGDQWVQVMNKRVMRLTNYFSPCDAALAVSNAKRLGVAARAGRRGLPEGVGEKFADVNCGPYFLDLKPPSAGISGAWSHSWYFEDKVFARDLAMTLEGAIDREYIPTRQQKDGQLILQDAQRPTHIAAWGIDDAAHLAARTV